MNVCIFLGPTLDQNEAIRLLDADYIAPAQQGDVYRVAKHRKPRVIGIIDGYFEGVLSVWHKEILWTMSEGIHVFGSASMGALRAAELAPFGMQGVGRVFEWFRDGVLEDDDEVAVQHYPAEAGYKLKTEAMVNVRATLGQAVSDGVIGDRTRDALREIAKQIHYQDREWDYSAIVQRALQENLPAHEIDGLQSWLPRGRIDQKREDARDMLETIRTFLAHDPPPKEVDFKFEHTETWDALIEHFAADPVDEDTQTAVIEELRLEGESYRRVRQAAILRMLALSETKRRGVEATPREVRATATRYREGADLFSAENFRNWLRANRLSAAEFQQLMERETRLGKLDKMSDPLIEPYIIEVLQTKGQHAGYLDRADAKRRTLATHGLTGAGFDRISEAPAQLIKWYFETRLKVPVPESIKQYALTLGYKSSAEFAHAVLREYLYLGHRQEPQQTNSNGTACP